jgi:hypothetical protein
MSRHSPPADYENVAPGALYREFLGTVEAVELAPEHSDPIPVGNADLADLPDTVQRYLRFMGVVGRPRDWSFQAGFTGRFRRGPGQSWMPCKAWQYNTATPIARVFHMRARFWRLVPMVARDTYVNGHGRMLGRILDRFTVVDGSGDEFDIGELSTFLNDAILLAPSMLLGANTTWHEVDHVAFDVKLTDGSRTVTARVSVDDRGAPTDFSTMDRFAALATGLEQARWSTPVEAWTTTNDRPVPLAASAVWHLPAGPFTYIDGHFLTSSMRYNVEPRS